MAISRLSINIVSSIIFFSFALITQLPYFFHNLGILSLYQNYPIAFNELTFWSQYQSDIYPLMSWSNPMKYNLIGALIHLSSNLFMGNFIFTFFPLIFSTLSFYLFLTVQDKYTLPKRWAILIAFLAISSSTNSTLWSLIINFFFHQNDSLEIFNHFDLLISFSSSIALCIFLILLVPSINLYQMKYNPPKFLGLCWGITIIIHPSIFFFGYIFLILNFLVRHFRLSDELKRNELINLWYTCIVPLFIALPFIALNLNSFEFFDPQFHLTDHDFLRELITYCIFPFCMLYLASIIFRVDPYEVTLRFLPILVMSLAEVMLRVFIKIGIITTNMDFVMNNISVYFLHFFYYVPLISVLTRENKYEMRSKDFYIAFLSSIRNFIYLLTKFMYIPLLVLSLVLIILPLKDKYLSSETTKFLSFDALTQLNIINKATSNQLNPEVYYSMEKNLTSNFVLKDKPFLSSFLIGKNKISSDFHKLYWILYDHNQKYLLRDMQYNDRNFNEKLTQKDLQIFYWLIFNRSDFVMPSINIKNDLCGNYFLAKPNLFAIKENFEALYSINRDYCNKL